LSEIWREDLRVFLPEAFSMMALYFTDVLIFESTRIWDER
jgi:hypothetical protein